MPADDPLIGESTLHRDPTPFAPAPAAPSPAQAAPAPATPAAPARAEPRYSEPADETPSQPAAAAPPRVVLDAMRQRGLAVDGFGSDDEFLSVLGDAHSRAANLQELERLAHYGRQYVQQQMQAAEQPKPAATPAAEKPKWQGPKAKEEWKAHIKWDGETGRYIPNGPYASLKAVEEANDYLAAKQQYARRMEEDPFGLVREAGLDEYLEAKLAEVEKRTYERIRSEQAQTATVQQAHGFIEQNRNVLFQLTAEGQPLINRQTGDPVLAPAGIRFRQICDTLKQRYPGADQNALIADAWDRLQYELPAITGQASAAAAPAAPQETPAEANARLKKQTVQDAARVQAPNGRGAHAPQRGGARAIEESDEQFAVNPRASFLEMARKEALAAGLSLN